MVVLQISYPSRLELYDFEPFWKLEKSNEKQRKDFDKLKIGKSTISFSTAEIYIILASEKESSKATEAEQKFQSIKRELDDFKLKNKKQKVSQNDVRLQRALEEVNFSLWGNCHRLTVR